MNNKHKKDKTTSVIKNTPNPNETRIAFGCTVKINFDTTNRVFFPLFKGGGFIFESS